MNWLQRYAAFQDWRKDPELISAEHKDLEKIPDPHEKVERLFQHYRDHQEFGGTCLHCNREEHNEAVLLRGDMGLEKYRNNVNRGLLADPREHSQRLCPECKNSTARQQMQRIIDELG